MAEKPFNPTSLGIIEVIPSPVTSENESEPITLLAINSRKQQTNKKKGNASTKTKWDEPLLQELTLEEQHKRTGQTSGSDSETGSWDSIILETPEGVRREYIVKPSTDIEMGSTKPVNVLIVTRAQLKKAQDNKGEVGSITSATPSQNKKKPRTSRKKSKGNSSREYESDASMKKILESRKELPKSDSRKTQEQGNQTKDDLLQ